MFYANDEPWLKTKHPRPAGRHFRGPWSYHATPMGRKDLMVTSPCAFLVSSLQAVRIEAVRDGEEANRILDAHGEDFDLVLLSADLPELDVLAVFRRLRALDGNMRFVFVGGEQPLGGQLRYLVEGDDRVILVQKPFGVAELKHAVDEMTKRTTRGESEVS